MAVRKAYGFLAGFFILNLLTWMASRPVQAVWTNVPPPPAKSSAILGAYGDKEVAYRSIGYMLQNLGDHGGNVRNIDEYNYTNLKKWLFLTDELNQKSNFVPRLAGLYFGITKKPEHAAHLVEYLSYIGARPYDGKWRWLLLASTYSKNKMKDIDQAIQYAKILQNMDYQGSKPPVANRLTPMLYFSKGDKPASFIHFMEVLHKTYETLPAREQEFVLDFFCREFQGFYGEYPACPNSSYNL